MGHILSEGWEGKTHKISSGPDDFFRAILVIVEDNELPEGTSHLAGAKDLPTNLFGGSQEELPGVQVSRGQNMSVFGWFSKGKKGPPMLVALSSWLVLRES